MSGMKSAVAVAVICVAVSVGGRAAAETGAGEGPGVIYAVAASHLDTQWWWTIQETISDLIVPTFKDTMDLLDKYHGFNFSWEGAFRYMLLEEYRPDLYSRLAGYMDSGRWSPGGSSVDAGDVNVPSPESLVRQFLYGNRYFRDRFGRSSVDVFLPDCFGFGWALPSVAAHCGLKGFSTAKLEWGGAIPIPFGVGYWKGPDGAGIFAALKPGAYTTQLSADPGLDPRYVSQLDAQETASGLRLGFMYYGVGDRGGSPGEASIAIIDAATARTDGPKVLSTSSDRIFSDISAEEAAALPVHDSELLMQIHGTGSYTAQSAMKRYNRKNELLADAAERAATAASWLGDRPYPADALEADWIRFLWHHFHDDLTGTSIPEVYAFSWNDEFLTLNRFAAVLLDSAGMVARRMDTRVQGTALLVFNPLAFEREDCVDATVPFPDGSAPYPRVFGPDGSEVPSQVTSTRGGSADIVFAASLPAAGFAVYDVRWSDVPCTIDSGLKTSANAIENMRYRVQFNDTGDISSVFDKVENREMLGAPAGIDLFMDMSFVWPAWELHWEGLRDGPLERVSGNPTLKLVETGPARVKFEISKQDGSGSVFVQRVSLAAHGAGDIVRIDAEIDWRTMATLAKYTVVVKSGNEKAAYDLGLGTIERGTNTPLLFEVPAQQWADITAVDGSYGVSVVNDCKYGWDHPDPETIRMTLIHTPAGPTFSQHTLDFGHHQVSWGLYGHRSDWRNGTPQQGARFNQPPIAFVVSDAHEGVLGRAWSMFGVEGESAGQVAVRAVKGDEDGRGLTVVRLQELHGRAASGVALRAPGRITMARMLDGMEDDRGALEVQDGKAILDIGPYGIATVGVAYDAPAVEDLPASDTESVPLVLEYNVDVVSSDDARSDGAFDQSGNSWAAPLWPAETTWSGVRFVLGPTEPGSNNAVECRGQKIAVDAVQGQRLYMLLAADEDVASVRFVSGDMTWTFPVQSWTGFIGQWDGRIVNGRIVETRDEMVPAYLKQDPVAMYGSHRHGADGDQPYVFTYAFAHVLDIPAGMAELTLPDDPRIKLLAVTLAADRSAETAFSSRLYDYHDPIAATGLHAPDPEPTVPADQVEQIPDAAADAGTDASLSDAAATDMADGATSGDDGNPADDSDSDGRSGGSSGCSTVAGHAAQPAWATVIAVVMSVLVLASTRVRARRRN